MNAEIYDRDREFPMCLAAPQKAPLVFASQAFPRTKDVVRVAFRSEVLVSERVARLLEDDPVTGCTTRRIFERRRPRSALSRLREMPGWRQLVITAETGPVADRTVFGRDIFHPDHDGRRCDVCGLTREDGLLSELFLARDGWPGTDVAVTRDRIGGRAGTPRPLLVIAPRFHRWLVRHQVKGYAVEVARLV